LREGEKKRREGTGGRGMRGKERKRRGKGKDRKGKGLSLQKNVLDPSPNPVNIIFAIKRINPYYIYCFFISLKR